MKRTTNDTGVMSLEDIKEFTRYSRMISNGQLHGVPAISYNVLHDAWEYETHPDHMPLCVYMLYLALYNDGVAGHDITEGYRVMAKSKDYRIWASTKGQEYR